MKAIVLGSAAGGGVPQWNCRCAVCQLAWAGDTRVTPRSQSSLAVSVDGGEWLLVNASPDLRQQIAATRELHPREGARHSPLRAVLLTNGDVDHVAGLLTLRERQPFDLYATEGVLQTLDANRIFAVCAPDVVPRRPVKLDVPFEPLPGLRAEIFAVPGKVALWLEDETMRIGAESETTVGLDLTAGGKRMVYVPGCAAVTGRLRERVAGADVLFFDGTMWSDDEMVAAGLGAKTARRMGHAPLSGEDGSLAALHGLAVGRRVLVHINNTNPILVAGSPEALMAEAAGWDIGFDGIRIAL